MYLTVCIASSSSCVHDFSFVSCLDPGAATVFLWSDIGEIDWFQPLVLQKQTSAIEISGWLASPHLSFLLHFQPSLPAIFHWDTPTCSSNARSLLCSSSLCCSLSVCFSALFSFSPMLLLYFSFLRLCHQTLFSSFSSFFSWFLLSLSAPPSISCLCLSLPLSVRLALPLQH